MSSPLRCKSSPKFEYEVGCPSRWMSWPGYRDPSGLVFGHPIHFIPSVCDSVSSLAMLFTSPLLDPHSPSVCTCSSSWCCCEQPVTFPSLPSLEWTEECPSLPPPAAPNHVSNNQEAVREAPVQGNSLVKPAVKEHQVLFPENEMPLATTRAVFPRLVTHQGLCLLIWIPRFWE